MHMVKLVDSIAAVPTTRLNLSDGTIWRVTSFDAPPPRLRRSMSQNAMTDGGFVSSSQYEMRTLTIGLVLNQSTQDANATQLQTLARELDRETNYLMYQPVGATKPVFFRTVRSDFTAIREMPVHATGVAMRGIEVEILAEPFALGLKETLGPYTVNNDPAAGSNGCYFDVTGVIGDVAAPAVLVDSSRTVSTGVVATRSQGTPSDMIWFTQAESSTVTNVIPDTSNPGGGPDAVMSGTGTNNFRRTTFATSAALVSRLAWDPGSGATDAQLRANRGRYRVFAVVRRSDNSSAMTVQFSSLTGSGPVTTLPLTTSRILLELGIHSHNFDSPSTVGYSSIENPVDNRSSPTFLTFSAGRSSGAGTLDWDLLMMVPADEAMLIWNLGNYTNRDTIIDGYRESVSSFEDGADPFAGSASILQAGTMSGGFPALTPAVTNRVFYFQSASPVMTKTDTSSVTAHYWPRYLYVRPSAT